MESNNVDAEKTPVKEAKIKFQKMGEERRAKKTMAMFIKFMVNSLILHHIFISERYT